MATDFEDKGGGLALVFGETSGGVRVALCINSSGQLELVEAASPVVTNATGTAAIAASYAPAAPFWLDSVTCRFDAAPTTSEDFTVKLNANNGVAYDAELYSEDPSVYSAQDIVYQPEGGPLLCESGDAIDVDFPGSDGKRYGLRIVTRLA